MPCGDARVLFEMRQLLRLHCCGGMECLVFLSASGKRQMTCTGFEAHSGQGRHKKWKNSIKLDEREYFRVLLAVKRHTLKIRECEMYARELEMQAAPKDHVTAFLLQQQKSLDESDLKSRQKEVEDLEAANANSPNSGLGGKKLNLGFLVQSLGDDLTRCYFSCSLSNTGRAVGGCGCTSVVLLTASWIGHEVCDCRHKRMWTVSMVMDVDSTAAHFHRFFASRVFETAGPRLFV